jgi:hypothetical protein
MRFQGSLLYYNPYYFLIRRCERLRIIAIFILLILLFDIDCNIQYVFILFVKLPPSLANSEAGNLGTTEIISRYEKLSKFATDYYRILKIFLTTTISSTYFRKMRVFTTGCNPIIVITIIYAIFYRCITFGCGKLRLKVAT